MWITLRGINDTWGHHAGDLALKAIADTVRGCVRNTDMLVRYGGDEFVLVLQDIPKDILKKNLNGYGKPYRIFP